MVIQAESIVALPPGTHLLLPGFLLLGFNFCVADVISQSSQNTGKPAAVIGPDATGLGEQALVGGKIGRLRQVGQGMIRESFTKTAAGMRVLPLPSFAIATLMGRQVSAAGSIHDVVFPPTQGSSHFLVLPA